MRLSFFGIGAPCLRAFLHLGGSVVSQPSALDGALRFSRRRPPCAVARLRAAAANRARISKTQLSPQKRGPT